MPLVSKGGEDELKAIHASLYALYFSFSTNNASCFQGREERTEGIPRNPLHYLLLIFNKQRLLFPREGRMNWKQSMRAFTLFTSHSQQTTPLVSKGGKSELRAFHAILYIIYFSFLTNNASCFQGRGGWTESNPCEPLRCLLLILNKQRLLFPREERMNRGQSTRAFTSFTSHSQQATTSCFQGKRERTEGNPYEPLHYLLLILNKQRPPVSKGGKVASWVLIW